MISRGNNPRNGGRRDAARRRLASIVRHAGAVAFIWAVAATVSADPVRLWRGNPLSGTLANAIDALKAGKLTEADALFEKALEDNPDTAMATLARADIAVSQARLADAEKAVDGVLARRANLPEAHNMKGLLLMLRQHPDAARKEFTRAIELHPKYISPRVYLAMLTRAAGNQRETEAAYRQLTVLAPRLAAGYLGIAEAQFLQNRPEAAMQTLADWQAADPRNPVPLQVIAGVHSAKGESKQAVQSLSKALALDPHNVVTLTSLGAAYLTAGDATSASTQFTNAIAIEPRNIVANLGLADIAVQAGQNDAAMARYRSVLKADPGNAVASNNLAWMLAESGGKLDEALRLAQAGIKRDPSYVDAYDTLGWVYYRRGEFARAVGAFSKAVQMTPNRGDLAAHLGMAYNKAGNKSLALAELRRALASGTPLSNREEIVQLVQSLTSRP